MASNINDNSISLIANDNNVWRYGDSVNNTVEENSPVSSPQYTDCCQQGHAGSKILHQQNPPVPNKRCWLMQADLYSGHKTVAVLCCWQLCSKLKKKSNKKFNVSFYALMLLTGYLDYAKSLSNYFQKHPLKHLLHSKPN